MAATSSDINGTIDDVILDEPDWQKVSAQLAW